jgi:hypothetical protein
MFFHETQEIYDMNMRAYIDKYAGHCDPPILYSHRFAQNNRVSKNHHDCDELLGILNGKLNDIEDPNIKYLTIERLFKVYGGQIFSKHDVKIIKGINIKNNEINSKH